MEEHITSAPSGKSDDFAASVASGEINGASILETGHRTPLQIALDYAAEGTPVFPCNNEKAPLTKNGFQDATVDADQIERWWRKHPNALIGVPTGEMTGKW